MHSHLLAALLLLNGADLRAAPEPADKTVKTLITAIRYGKDDLAAKQLAFAKMAQRLLADDCAKMSADEQTEFASGLETLLRTTSFPKGKDTFKYLDAVLYDKPRTDGGDTRVKSTIVIHRDLKKTEMVIDWVLVDDGGAWKVIDTVMLGESTLDGIREEEVQPLIKEGGTPAVMKAMRAKVAEAKKT